MNPITKMAKQTTKILKKHKKEILEHTKNIAEMTAINILTGSTTTALPKAVGSEIVKEGFKRVK